VTYKVRLSPHAARDYKKLDPPLKAQLQAAINILQSDPLDGPKIKRLKGLLREYYRYRVGDYRLVYTVAQGERVVYVDYLQHRKEAYRRIE